MKKNPMISQLHIIFQILQLQPAAGEDTFAVDLLCTFHSTWYTVFII